MQYVAGEMQKDEHFRVKNIPLLIGGATPAACTRRQDRSRTTKAPVVYARRLAQRGRGAKPAGRRRARAMWPAERRLRKVRTQHANKGHALLAPGQIRANKDADGLVGIPACRARARWAAACSRTSTWPSWPITSTGARSSDPGPGWTDTRDPHRRGGGRRPRVFADGQAMPRKIIAVWLTASGVMAAAARQQRGRRHRSSTPRHRTEVAMTWYGPAPAG